eukprot:c43982_g1_i1 orf=43-318(-)
MVKSNAKAGSNQLRQNDGSKTGVALLQLSYMTVDPEAEGNLYIASSSRRQSVLSSKHRLAMSVIQLADCWLDHGPRASMLQRDMTKLSCDI